MKQYARIFDYLKVYKGKIVLYFLFTLLSIVFSIVSIGMLMPFLQLIFTGSNTAITSTSNNPIIKSVND
ncbi:MAG: ABC transporter ATP-binding protein, partial [Bacteroidota bacterium]